MFRTLAQKSKALNDYLDRTLAQNRRRHIVCLILWIALLGIDTVLLHFGRMDFFSFDLPALVGFSFLYSSIQALIRLSRPEAAVPWRVFSLCLWLVLLGAEAVLFRLGTMNLFSFALLALVTLGLIYSSVRALVKRNREDTPKES